MNFLTEADAEPRQRFQPGKICNRWDMLKIDASAFFYATVLW